MNILNPVKIYLSPCIMCQPGSATGGGSNCQGHDPSTLATVPPFVQTTQPLPWGAIPLQLTEERVRQIAREEIRAEPSTTPQAAANARYWRRCFYDACAERERARDAALEEAALIVLSDGQNWDLCNAVARIRALKTKHAGVAQSAAAEEEGARASTPSAGHAEHRGGSDSLTTKDAGSSPAPSSLPIDCGCNSVEMHKMHERSDAWEKACRDNMAQHVQERDELKRDLFQVRQDLLREGQERDESRAKLSKSESALAQVNHSRLAAEKALDEIAERIDIADSARGEVAGCHPKLIVEILRSTGRLGGMVAKTPAAPRDGHESERPTGKADAPPSEQADRSLSDCPVCGIPVPEAEAYVRAAIAFALSDQAWRAQSTAERATVRHAAREAFGAAKEALARAPR